MLSQDPVGQTPSNQWEDLIFDQSRVIEPRDQPYKKAVSNSFASYDQTVSQCHCIIIIMLWFAVHVVLLFFFLSINFLYSFLGTEVQV